MDKSEIRQKYTMISILIIILVLVSVLTGGKFLMPKNITNIISQNAYVFVLATGMLMCILTGGNIDLSVGSVVCFTGAVGAVMMDNGISMWIAIPVMLIVGTLIGAWQAFWIAFMRIPPFIVTLSGMLVFRGLSNVILDGKTVSVTNETFIRIFGGGANCYIPDIRIAGEINLITLIIGCLSAALYVFLSVRKRSVRKKNGHTVSPLFPFLLRIFLITAAILFFTVKLSQYRGIPTALLWVAIVIGFYTYLTSNTTVGRHLYAVGGNENATRLSGVNTNNVYFFSYTNMGFLSAVAGILTIARMSSAQPTYGQNYEMDAIGACFIGGASAYGGTGSVPSVIIGAVLMGVINIGMSILGVDANYQKVVKGAMLLAVVIFDVTSKKNRKS